MLEIPKTATEADIKKAYRKLALKWHPVITFFYTRTKTLIIRRWHLKNSKKLQKLMKYSQNQKRNLIMINMDINNHLHLLVNNIHTTIIKINIMIFRAFRVSKITSIQDLIKNSSFLNKVLGSLNLIECLI